MFEGVGRWVVGWVGGGTKGFLTALGRIDVGVCYTKGVQKL